MYDIFINRFDTNVLPMMGAHFETTKRVYRRELDKLIAYYRDRTFMLPNQHLLCRILETGTPPLDYEPERFSLAASARSPFIARSFQLTSESSFGKHHDGVFYGDGSSEIILSIEDPFSISDALENWEDIKCIRVIEHAISDLGMMIPNGRRNSVDTGLAVFTLDLPKLFFQYRCWQLDQRKRFPDSQLGKSHFVFKYILPQILESQLDIAIRNRLINMFYGIPMGAPLRRHAISISDYTDKVDDCLRRLLPRLKNAKMLYQTAMVHIPSVSARDGYDALMIPDMVPTAQCRWALYLSRLSTVKFLRDLQGENREAYNSTYERSVLVETRRISNDSSFPGRVPSDIYYDVSSAMREISGRGI